MYKMKKFRRNCFQGEGSEQILKNDQNINTCVDFTNIFSKRELLCVKCEKIAN